MALENRAEAGRLLAGHLRDFSQVSDEEVVATLREARRPRVATGTSA